MAIKTLGFVVPLTLIHGHQDIGFCGSLNIDTWPSRHWVLWFGCCAFSSVPVDMRTLKRLLPRWNQFLRLDEEFWSPLLCDSVKVLMPSDARVFMFRIDLILLHVSP